LFPVYFLICMGKLFSMKNLTLTLLSLLCGWGSLCAQVIYFQDFESTTGTSLPTGWSQTVAIGIPNDSVGWNTGSVITLNSAGFNPPDHSRFVAVNDDKYAGANNSNSFLISPLISLSGISSPYLSFDCCYLQSSYGGFTEKATVEVSIDSGHTWTVVSILAGNTQGWWEPRYINLSAYAGTPAVEIGFRYSDNTGWELGWGIDNILIYTPPAADLALTSVKPDSSGPTNFAAAGTPVNFTGTVFNFGTNPVSGFDLIYQQGSNAAVTTSVSGVLIPPFSSYNFTDTAAYIMPAYTGNYPFQVWIYLAGDNNHSNDTLPASLNDVTFMPAKRPLIEELTGTWCGLCVSGFIYLDSLRSLYSGTADIVSVHDHDPMGTENTHVENYDWYLQTIPIYNGFPGMFVDRRSYSNPFELITAYNQDAVNFGFADISAASNLDTAGNLTISCQVKPAINLTGDYRLELILEEINVNNTGSGYSQHDDYSFQSGNLPLAGEGFNFQDSQVNIASGSMYYNFVARYTVPDLDPVTGGVSYSLPNSMTADSFYAYSFDAIALAHDWSPENLYATILLIDNNVANTTYMQVLNSVQTKVLVPAAVTNPNVGAEGLRIFPNPASDEVNIRFRLNYEDKVSVNVKDMLGRSLISNSGSVMNEGEQQLTISTRYLPDGMYIISINTTGGILSGRLSVSGSQMR